MTMIIVLNVGKNLGTIYEVKTENCIINGKKGARRNE